MNFNNMLKKENKNLIRKSYKKIYPLVYAKRGELKEKVFHGVYVIINEKGDIVYSYGDHNYITFSRSTAKPFQVLPLIVSGAYEKFNFNKKELSLMCSSHFGENFHVETLYNIMKKASISEDELLCPITYSRNKKIREAQKKEGISPSKFYSDCSAKHLQMIAYSKYMYEKTKNKDYLSFDKNRVIYDKLRNSEQIYNYKVFDHPVQQDIRKILSIIYDTDEANFIAGIDGCGVPVYSSSVINMAKAYLKLITSNIFATENNKEIIIKKLKSLLFEENINEALNLIKDAMISFPEMIAGTDGLCSLLTKIFNGNGIAKVGADGVYCVGIKKDNKYYGIALKIIDGDYEISEFAIVNILKKHGFLDSCDISLIEKYINRINLNEHGEPVGEYGLCI
ncbi:MAG: asparaginase [Spirochaetes bacterium]|nr:asparaginase [Spirochaetota bacterium]